MRKWKVTARQMVEEVAEIEVTAETLGEAWTKANELIDDGDVDWVDGTDISRGEVIRIERID